MGSFKDIYYKIMNPLMPKDRPRFQPWDPKNYKIEECPDLVNYKKLLDQHGLKDPHLRNLVWLYHPSNMRMPYTHWRRLAVVSTKGIIPGFFLAMSYIAYYKFTGDPEEEHGHH